MQDSIIVRLLSGFLLLSLLGMPSGQAQSIISASDGTQTIVTPNGTILTITGGQISGDGANLFHSFAQFGLNSQQIANFLSTPGIQNILARVVGGDPSIINGLIQVTGSNANLYLMNPAGIVFGPTASLNVPAAFTATTANRIGFSNGGQFNTVGPNSYATLTGLPQDFTFTALQPGAIVNAGQLTVGQGQAVTLLGGVVINTGTIAAPGGQITIAAVPGQKLVRVSQSGSLLSLDLPVGTGQMGSSIQALDLPALLASPAVTGATGVVVENGEVKLTSANTVIPTTAGTTIVAGTLTTASPSAQSEIKVLGDRIGLYAAHLDASGPSGGTILIGGDYQGQGTIPNAQITYVSPDSMIQADAIGQGNGGKVIVWADQTTVFRGSISAQGGPTGGDGGFVEVSGKQNLGFTGQVSTVAPQGQTGTLLLDPDNVQIIGSNPAPQDLQFIDGQILAGDAPPATFVISDTALGSFALANSDIVVQANSNIAFDSNLFMVFAGGTGSIVLIADADNNGTGSFLLPFTSVIVTNGKSLSIAAAQLAIAGDIGTTSAFGQGGNITLTTQSSASLGNLLSDGLLGGGQVTIAATGAIQVSSISAQSSSGPGGNVSLSTQGQVTVGTIGSDGLLSGGQVTIAATGAIQVSSISAQSSSGTGGNVSLSTQGQVTVGTIGSDGLLSGGQVTIAATGAIQVSSISAQSSSGTGGNVSISTADLFQATGTFLAVNGLDASIATIGATGGGAITITQGGNGLIPFTIGDASQNGTAGVVTSGSNTLLVGESFQFRTIRGNIRINGLEPQEVTFQKEISLPQEEKLEIKPACGLSGTGSSFTALEQQFTATYERYFGHGGGRTSADSACASLANIAEATGVKPALIYVSFAPPGDRLQKSFPGMGEILWQWAAPGFAVSLSDPQQSGVPKAQDRDQLVMILVTAKGLTQKKIPVSRMEVLQAAKQLRISVSNLRDDYQIPAERLYQWLIAPLDPILQQQNIENLVFIMDTGLRTLPIATLYDGQHFLVEKYSVGLMPSLSLTDTRRVSIREAQVLAMGASQFKDQSPLPAVPIELMMITQRLRAGKSFLNQDFTISNLKSQRSQNPVAILHLATHGEFRAGSAANSYIQFWDRRLGLDEIRQLGLNNPIVELLVLSACRTAVGSDEAELGFGGLAVQAGVKTVLASLWYVSDEGTLALMTQFYESLKTAPTKAEALQQAQVAMLREQIYLDQGKLIYLGDPGLVELPAPFQDRQRQVLSHPYYWAAFTMIGNPW
ncbi:hypothetical protein BST81_04490 [Leptolyngbya sp. 'hensonii']|uniref:CHAT domain-containing protein n=1 Tax=Leptolyngbya sp. 'hensonii' TaxID=1922337 RepID=UPI00094F64EF|nr:CHAT domain-containing protein [Leptolyngbya sp. 'hensonii']OLP19534.1 hypothetical protein BST81_04490 [Leptolyngbya sp. 'hensonii']